MMGCCNLHRTSHCNRLDLADLVVIVLCNKGEPALVNGDGPAKSDISTGGTLLTFQP